MIPPGWKTDKLRDLVEINKTSLGINHGFDWIEYLDTSSVVENRFDGIKILKANKAPSRAKRIVKINDIIYSTVRPIQRHYGFIGQAKENTIASTGFAVITPTKIDPKFLYYYLTRDEIVNYLNGIAESNTTTFPAFNASLLNDLVVIIPENFDEQNKISSILSSLDDKIELNLQMNKTLESIVLAIFKEWFIDFRFPGFDGELVDGLPKGWRKGRLGEDFNIIMGQSPPGESYNQIEEGTVFYQGRTDFGFRFPENRMYTTAPNRMAKRLDTLVSVRAPVGDINMALENCCIGRGLSAVRHISGGHSYTYYAMKSVENIFKGFEGEGTVFGSINKNNFENINMVMPEVSVIEQFEKLINPIDEKILINSIEIKTLTTIRDSLLPKLMTGKIRVA